jgi:hypothetical protein
MNPVARPGVRRYGKCHDDAFERDELVVGLLTAARLRMRARIWWPQRNIRAAICFSGAFRTPKETDGDGNDHRSA